MTATDELRRMLNERGVEWTANDGEYVKETCWPYMGELMAAFAEYDNGETRFACDTWCFTPEQAVEATLGRGTCKVDSFADVRFAEEDNPEHDYEYATLAECSECGAVLLMPPPYIWYDDRSLYAATNYCPNCGREVTASAQDDG